MNEQRHQCGVRGVIARNTIVCMDTCVRYGYGIRRQDKGNTKKDQIREHVRETNENKEMRI